ncbi:hypothetical protein SLEP1_g35531 [Rubroshorea leprosula]|nr:hypothetical protein SLEP1_g35531 [Rubroshorea leprosula]
MLAMKETETVHQYSTKLIDIINQIRLQGEDFPDKRVIDKIMVSVPDKFESKILAIEESNDLNQLTINELISKLKAYEQRLSIKGAEVPEEALQAKEKGKQAVETPNSAEYEKEKMLDNSASSSSSSTSASSWYIDSGCTSHMARDESIFLDLDKSVKTSVKLGNGTVVFSQGKGTTVIPTRSDDFCYIHDSFGMEVARVKMVQNSFLLDMQSVQKCLHAFKVNDTLLWHKRYGHFNVKALKYMQTNELIRDFPEVHVTNEVCQCCQLGKMHRLSFPINKAFRACEKLELVHTDICGPMKVPSLGQNKYFILFIDDFTRMTWVYFLSSKAQVFSMFKKFKALVENQSGCRIKKLRSDNGKEYTSAEFNNFCEEAGIQHQLTVSYTPQQNEVSERKNRTVMERANYGRWLCMNFSHLRVLFTVFIQG